MFDVILKEDTNIIRRVYDVRDIYESVEFLVYDVESGEWVWELANDYTPAYT